MPTRELPARPNLEQLKKQAKSLLDAAIARDSEALRRFAILPALAGKSLEAIATRELALHDAQSAIAREHGFESWNALREEVESRTLSFEAAVDEFIRCATGGAQGRAERLLSLYPRIATATLETALVLGDAAAVEVRLARHPQLASATGGPQQWEPLLYLCHTSMHKGDPARIAGLVAIAKRLCALGANPNAEYHWNWHPELPRTALWASVCEVRHLPLAEVLLEAGANPTDGVTAHIASGGGNLEALELLARYGLRPDGIPGGVPPLLYMMQWADTPVGAYWLLEHGADANLAWGVAGDAPLHVAANRWDVAMSERLVQHGADVSRRRDDGATPHTVAELSGNTEVAAWLLAHGAVDELSPLERFAAACARGDRAAADAILAAHPQVRSALRPEHHLMLHRPAESGNARVLDTMLACGFDADARDKDGVTPLHRASMGGHVEAVRVLLAHGADKAALDGMFAAPPLVWAVEGRSHSRDPRADFVGVARVLIAAGSPVDWTPPPGAPAPERTLGGLLDLRRDAAEGDPESRPKDASDRTSFLHVANGTSTTRTIEAAGIPGRCSIWADPLHEGPVPGNLNDSELMEVRGRFLSGPVDASRPTAGNPALDPVNDMHQWRAIIAAHDAYEELVLWFEHDLFDQLNLIQLLTWIHDNVPLTKPVSLVCIGSFPGRPNFKGLGELTPTELAPLLGTRQRVDDRQYELAARAWSAFRAPTPEPLDALRRDDTSALPYLAPAIARFLQEYPWTRDGLSRSERRLMELASDGIELMRAFPRMHDGEQAYYVTDGTLQEMADAFAQSQPPLLTLDPPTAADHRLLRRKATLTEIGRSVASGALDRISTCGIDRWLGGVHLHSGGTIWRWDEARQRVQP